jgi:hypothetical protein
MKKPVPEPFKFGQRKSATRTRFPAVLVKPSGTAPASSSAPAKALKQAAATKK